MAEVILFDVSETLLDFHYGYWDDPERMRAANELTLFEWDPVSKQPHFKYAAVSVTCIEAPTTAQPDTRPTTASLALSQAKHAAEAVVKMIKPERAHVREYLGLLEGSERALADALEKVAEAHPREPDIRERIDSTNNRQRTWLITRAKRAAPQALVVPS